MKYIIQIEDLNDHCSSWHFVFFIYIWNNKTFSRFLSGWIIPRGLEKYTLNWSKTEIRIGITLKFAWYKWGTQNRKIMKIDGISLTSAPLRYLRANSTWALHHNHNLHGDLEKPVGTYYLPLTSNKLGQPWWYEHLLYVLVLDEY